MRRLYEETKDHVQFLLVYVREAHPNDEWEMPDNKARGIDFAQPTSHSARITVARECVADCRLEMPTVVDALDDRVNKLYGAWPDRLYVIDARGRIAYQGGVGPFGFKPDEVREFLRTTYGY